VLRPVQEAFFAQRALELTYRTREAATVRVVEPHSLLLSWPAWYLLVWDHLREAPRNLRLDRIESARLRQEAFALREVGAMKAELAGLFTPV